MKIFSSSQIQQADAYTIANEPVLSIDLMERAAMACFNWLQKNFSKQKQILIFCGNGNNGGDGLAIGRMLLSAGWNVTCYIITESKNRSADCEINFTRLQSSFPQSVVLVAGEKELPKNFSNSIIVDALFGTGLNKPAAGIYKKTIEQINNSGCEIISIDMPSGLFADKSSVEPHPNPLQRRGSYYNIIKATHTLSFQFYKLAFMFAENASYFGIVHILDIGLSRKFIDDTDSAHQITDIEKIKQIIKPRNPFSHKGNYGHALLIAGSKGKIGAAVLAAKACLRSGTGLLTVQVPKCGYTVLQTKVPEAMCIEDEHPEFITSQIVYSPYTAIGIGPGLNTMDETAFLLHHILTTAHKPMVIDADALNIISKNKNWLNHLPQNSILTPHPKEFERLFGETKNNFERNDLQLQCSKKYNTVIVLKGKYTCITSPDGKCYFNPTGNAGLAKGGSGDVLTGIITALLAQGIDAFSAAVSGVYLHGLAADVAAEKFAEHAMVASDVISCLSDSFNKI